MLEFYKGKRVFVTGHTGFKGSWICQTLKKAGAIITGFALAPNTTPALFEIADISNGITSIIGDIRDLSLLKKSLQTAQPEIILHLAAQPLVRESYKNPVYTYETNVMGTVNILEAIRFCSSVRSFINITTDKVYLNKEWCWGYRENEELNGFDPYSNSKSCSELVTFSFQKSFLADRHIAVSTARAGNVIGGGDFATDRIIPDCIRAALAKTDIAVRNPSSIRPYQHVLEPVFAYLLLAKLQYEDSSYAGCYNIGPDNCDCITTGELATMFCNSWGNISWINTAEADAPYEANFLKLDCTKAKSVLHWSPHWHVQEAVIRTITWAKAYQEGKNMADEMDLQIIDYDKGNLI